MATRKIETELALSGEKAFNDAMKSVNSNLKTLKSDMAAATSEFGDNADSMEALTAKQEILEQSVDQHKEKVDALRKMYEKQKDTYGENSAQADKYKRDLNNAIVALNKERQALEKNTKALSEKNKKEDESEEETEESTKATEKAAKRQERLAAATEKTKAALEKFKPVVEGTGKVVGGIAKISAAAVTAVATAGTAAIAGMVNMAKESADAARAAADAGQELTSEQKTWLAFSDQLNLLNGSVANAKSAIAGILLPALSDLATEGTSFLNDFAKDMADAAGDTEKQTQVLSQYIANGAKLIIQKLPEYIKAGKNILGSALSGLGESKDELLDMGLSLITDFLDFIVANAPDFANAGLELVVQIIEGIESKGLAGSAVNMISQLVSVLANSAHKLAPVAKTLLDQLVASLKENGPLLEESAFSIINDLLSFFMENAPDLFDAGLELVMQLVEGIDGEDFADSAAQMVNKLVISLTAAAPKLIPAATKLVLELIMGLAQNAPQLLESGWDLIKAIISGALSSLQMIREMGPDIIDELVDGLRNSDSKILQFGADVIEWISDGIWAAWDGLVSWFNNLWDSLFSGRDVDVNVNASSNGGVDGSHAGGLRYVPFDGYLAELHRGEAVLPAAEAEAYRSGKTGGNKVFNLTVNAKTISKEDLDMMVDYMNRKLGEDL